MEHIVRFLSNQVILFYSHQIQYQGTQGVSAKFINKLYRAGARVLTNEAINNLHTSGHASQEEQKLMLLLTKT